MKIVLVSDTHGGNNILWDLQEKYKEASLFIHCGDLEDNPKLYPHWIIVRGNNDYWGEFADSRIIPIGKHRILVLHSDRFSFMNRNQALVHVAKENDCDIVFYGHTHVGKCEYEDGVYLINPGSIRYPRGGQSAQYAIVTIEDDYVGVEYFKQENWNF